MKKVGKGNLVVDTAANLFNQLEKTAVMRTRTYFVRNLKNFGFLTVITRFRVMREDCQMCDCVGWTVAPKAVKSDQLKKVGR